MLLSIRIHIYTLCVHGNYTLTWFTSNSKIGTWSLGLSTNTSRSPYWRELRDRTTCCTGLIKVIIKPQVIIIIFKYHKEGETRKKQSKSGIKPKISGYDYH